MQQVKSVPNEPARCIVVSFEREFQMYFGPNKGKTIVAVMHYAGVSFREVSIEVGAPERLERPVVWRFLQGRETGGDDLESSPPYYDVRIEIPPDCSSASAFIENGRFFHGKNYRWFLIEPESTRITD